MRSTIGIATLAAAGLTVAPTVSAQQFQGTVTIRNISVQTYALEARDFDLSEALFDVPIERILALRGELEADGDMTVGETHIFLSGSRMRVDAPDEDGPSYAILNLETKVMQVVRPEQRMYMEMTQADIDRMRSMSGMADADAAGAAPQVQSTGQTRSLMGMTCEVHRVTSDRKQTRLCVSDDDAALMSSFQALAEWSTQMNPGEAQDPSYAVAKFGFPLLDQTLDDDSYDIAEVTSIDRTPVPSDRFVPPEGFRKVTMADMMRGQR